MHNLYFFSYSSDSGTAPRDSTEEVCAATSMALEGICHMPMGNLWISTNFGIGKCEGMGGGGEINGD